MMRHIKTISIALLCYLLLSPLGVVVAQDVNLKLRYQEAVAYAEVKDFERAYETVFKVIRANEFYYEAQVLRIALAAILKKTASEDPRNLIRVARGYAPIGSDIERDVQNVINRLSNTPAIQTGEESTVLTKKEVAVSPYIRKKYALLVGIGTFQDTKINSLKFPANDAIALADALRQDCKFDYVKVLTDTQATRRNILVEMDNITKMTQPDDLVILYIASHGSPDDLDTAGVNYIITHDSEVENLFASSYPMKDFLDYIVKRLPAQRVVAFLDTCFSGATFKERPSNWSAYSRSLQIKPSGLLLEDIQKNLQGSKRDIKLSPSGLANGRRQQDIGRVIIASSRQNQTAWESAAIKHGYFTYYLIQALKREGAVSIQNLYDYLSSEVPKAVKADRNAEQNPTMISSVNGTINIYIKD